MADKRNDQPQQQNQPQQSTLRPAQAEIPSDVVQPGQTPEEKAARARQSQAQPGENYAPNLAGAPSGDSKK